MQTDTSLELEVLQDLDFPVPCGHSTHNEGSPRHDGPATHIAVSYHRCPERGPMPYPYYYPCCTRWAAYVKLCHAENARIICAKCGLAGFWSDFVQIVGPLP